MYLQSTRERHPRQRGEETRDAIKRILRERRRQGLRSPTLDELAELTGLSKTNIRHHLIWMEDHNVVRIERPRREIILLEDEGQVHHAAS